MTPIDKDDLVRRIFNSRQQSGIHRPETLDEYKHLYLEMVYALCDAKTLTVEQIMMANEAQ